MNITQNGSNLFGIKTSRTYNVRNIAAYTGQDPSRRNYLLWGGGRTGTDVLTNGVFVSLNKVPTDNASWTTSPYETQYLKVYDVTAPSTTPGSASTPNAYSYAIGTSVTVTWNAAPADGEGVTPCYRVDYTIDGLQQPTVITCSTQYTINAAPGQTVVVTIQVVNPSDNSITGPSSSPTTIKYLDPNGDDDGDGMDNAAEDVAGTNPFDPKSIFKVMNITRPDANTVSVTWSSVSGKHYQLESAPAPNGTYVSIGNQITANGSTTNESVTATTPAFYHVRVVP